MSNEAFGEPFVALEQGRAFPSRLNSLHLEDDPEIAAEKLIAYLRAVDQNGWRVRFIDIRSKLRRRELAAELRNIKQSLADANKMNSSNVVLRRDRQNARRYYFVAAPSCRVGTPLETVEPDTGERVFEMLLEFLVLRMAQPFSGKTASLVGPNGYAAQPFLLVQAMKSKRGWFHLHSLRVDLKLTRHRDFFIDLTKSLFSIPPQALGLGSMVTPLLVGSSVADFTVVDHVDVVAGKAGSKASRKAIPEIAFEIKDIDRSRWYRLNQVYGLVTTFLREAHVKFCPNAFIATHYLSRTYIKRSHIDFPPNLVVVFPPNFDLSSDGYVLEQRLQHHCRFEGINEPPRIEWMPVSDLEPEGVLRSDCGYLFLNAALPPQEEDSVEGDAYLSSEDDNEERTESCLVLGKPCEPERAFMLLARGEASLDEVDPYTRVKFRHIISSQRPAACLQGVNIGPDKKIEDLVLRKVLSEIALKWSMLKGEIRTVVPIPPMRMRAWFTRAGMHDELSFETIGCVELRVCSPGTSIQVDCLRIPPDDHIGVARMLTELPLLSRPSRSASGSVRSERLRLRDETFVLELLEFEGDPIGLRDDGTCLVVYDGKSTTLPRILGSMDQPLLHEQLDELIASLPSGSRALPKGVSHNLLPPLVAGFMDQPRRSELLFIDARNRSFLRYFVPSAQPLRDNLPFSRTYDLMLYKKTDSRRENPLPINLEHPLVRAYFSTMTQNVVRLGENSKNSLMRKLASLALLN